MNYDADISDSDLHAFIDGALDADRAQRVGMAIDADPALAARVAAFRADKAMLKQIYGPLAARPLPREWLALAQNARPASPMPWRLVGAIAALLLLALALAPFAIRTLQPGGEIVQAALAARQAPAEKSIAVADSGAQRYSAMLSAAVALPVKAPDLEKLGYQLTAIRLYPRAAGGSAAELLYRDRQDRLFTLYVRRSDGSARFDQFQRAGLRVCIWQDDQIGMVMAGNVTTAAMQRLASLAYTGLTS